MIQNTGNASTYLTSAIKFVLNLRTFHFFSHFQQKHSLKASTLFCLGLTKFYPLLIDKFKVCQNCKHNMLIKSTK